MTTTTSTHRPHVLLVEDDTFLASMYITKLELENFTATLATDGKQGLEKAQLEIPDCILLDVLLPKMNGFEVLKSLKDNSATANIPVILLTNLGQKADVMRGLSLGAVDYLIKAHFLPSEVIMKIKDALMRTDHERR
jgi:two-component system, OmpR family, phosphate regulon response regulator PhoB